MCVCVCVCQNTDSFGVGGCVIVIICPVPASLIFYVNISSGRQPRCSRCQDSAASCACPALVREADGGRVFYCRKLESSEHVCVSNPADYDLSRHLTGPSVSLAWDFPDCSHRTLKTSSSDRQMACRQTEHMGHI